MTDEPKTFILFAVLVLRDFVRIYNKNDDLKIM